MAKNDEYIFRKFYRELPPPNQICEACDFTFSDLAEKVGVSLRTIMTWNSGGQGPATLEGRIKLKQVYELYRKR